MNRGADGALVLHVLASTCDERAVMNTTPLNTLNDQLHVDKHTQTHLKDPPRPLRNAAGVLFITLYFIREFKEQVEIHCSGKFLTAPSDYSSVWRLTLGFIS